MATVASAHRLILVCAGALLLLGAGVMAGWMARSALITQISPQFAPMQFNTALGFFACGLALLAMQWRRINLARGAAAVVLALGLLTLLQYLLNWDSGLDTALVEPFTQVKTSHPGRMAPNTALCFLLAGAALLACLQPPARLRGSALIALITAATIFGLGAIALIGYAAGVETAYGWAHLTRMAVHTASGFLLVGAALAAVAIMLDQQHMREIGPAALGGLVLTSVTLLLWVSLEADQQRQLDLLVERQAGHLALSWQNELRRDQTALRRMASRAAADPMSEAEWQRDAAAYLADIPELKQISLHDPNIAQTWSLGSAASFPLSASAADSDAALQVSGSLDFVARIERLMQANQSTLRFEVARNGTLIRTAARDESGFYLYRKALQYQAGIEDFQVNLALTRRMVDEHRSRLPVLFLASGMLLSILGVFILLLLKQSRQQTRQIREQMQLSEAMQQQLQQQTIHLEASNQSLDDFAYVASHDLKEPLRGISSYAKFLLEDYADLLDQAGKNKLHTLTSLAKRMNTLIDELLHYSRVGKTDAAIEEVDLDELLDGVLETLAFSLREKQAEVIRPESLPRTICDRVRVREVFRNLIANAIKYSDQLPLRIEIGVDDADPPVFFVRDNGIGIDPAYHDKIFRIFTRLHHRDEYGGGTGAGLTIAQKIVESRGGRIWVESAPGEGSCFRFSLSASHQSAPDHPAAE